MSTKPTVSVRTIHDAVTWCDDDICCCEPEPRWQRLREEMEKEQASDAPDSVSERPISDGADGEKDKSTD